MTAGDTSDVQHLGGLRVDRGREQMTRLRYDIKRGGDRPASLSSSSGGWGPTSITRTRRIYEHQVTMYVERLEPTAMSELKVRPESWSSGEVWASCMGPKLRKQILLFGQRTPVIFSSNKKVGERNGIDRSRGIGR